MAKREKSLKPGASTDSATNLLKAYYVPDPRSRYQEYREKQDKIPGFVACTFQGTRQAINKQMYHLMIGICAVKKTETG